MNEQIISECMTLGCKSEQEAALITQIYLELCEVKKYWDVEYFFDEKLKRVLVRGKKSKGGPLCLFVPSPVSKQFTFNELMHFSSSPHKVYLAIVSADATCVYYEITNDLVPPNKADSSQTPRVGKREQIDSILKQHRKTLEEAALFGLPFKIPPPTTTKEDTSEDTT